MILVRFVFQAKFGKAGELAEIFKEFAGIAPSSGRSVRVLTDLSGNFDTVVQEVEFESFDVWQRSQAAMFADPRFREIMGRTSELIRSGSKEFYTIEA